MNDRRLIARDWAFHLENRLREAYGLQGVPLVIDYVPRKGRGTGASSGRGGYNRLPVSTPSDRGEGGNSSGGANSMKGKEPTNRAFTPTARQASAAGVAAAEVPGRG